ncbi:uncharacterized protein LOC142169613 [Nicotiana tabacum]|uniref:Uncharacterized protein LOC142169613 n=1 Tax=Nicotiana tabacum TaxID=4097 RepID=A0AC58SRJ9_TOBAC
MEKVKIVKVWLKTAQSRQKSYSNVRRIDLEFKEDDWRVGQVAYRLELPPEMSLVHSVFHVSMLKKVVGDPSLIVQVEAIEVNEELTYEKILVAILDRQVWKLRNKEISSIKVILRYQQVEEATWEAEEEMKRMPLFDNAMLIMLSLVLFSCYDALLCYDAVRIGFWALY